jgi:hypothetical protein
MKKHLLIIAVILVLMLVVASPIMAGQRRSKPERLDAVYMLKNGDKSHRLGGKSIRAWRGLSIAAARSPVISKLKDDDDDDGGIGGLPSL